MTIGCANRLPSTSAAAVSQIKENPLILTGNIFALHTIPALTEYEQ